MDRFPVKITAHRIKEITPVYVMRAHTQLEVELTIDKHQLVKFITDLFQQFDLDEINALLKNDDVNLHMDVGAILKTNVYDMDLSVRLLNTLRRNQIETAADIVNVGRAKIKTYRYMGEKALTELDNTMAQWGIKF